MSTDEDLVHPLPPIDDALYHVATESPLDFTELGVYVELCEIVRRGLCDLHGEDFYAELLDEPSAPFEDEAGRAIDALILHGIIRLGSL
jgi:hypothetical protein